MTPEAEMTAEAMTAEMTPEAVSMANAVMVSPDSEVVIGLAAAFSGEGLAPLGTDIRRGAELALEDRPTVTVGGVEFTVRLDAQDDLCSADGGQAVANRFVSDPQVVGVVGPMCSSACRAAAPIFDSAGYTSISPSCTAADLTTSGYASFNRAVATDATQGIIAAEYIYNTLGARRIATIHDGSPYGEGLIEIVSQHFTELGGEVVASDAISVGDTDFRGLLEDIAAQEPDLIYFGGFPAEASRLASQRADTGLEDVAFMGADGINTQEFIDLAGSAGEGVYSSKSIPASSDALDTFLARYVETYGEEPPAPFHANGYDATNLLLDAIEAVGTIDDNGDLVIDRAALSEYIRSVSDFQGLTGVLNADGSGEMSSADFGIFVVRGDELVQVAIGRIAEGAVEFETME
jgi:branched-chain amino acid transport system substrate-binding protein